MTEVSVATPMMPGLHGGQLRRGGGRPELSKQQREFMETLKAKTPQLAEALVKQALKGNVRALELALAYIIGKPVEKMELSGPDGGPITTHAVARDDHEYRLLRDAIDRELARRAGDREAAGAQALPAVAGPST